MNINTANQLLRSEKSNLQFEISSNSITMMNKYSETRRFANVVF